MDFQRFAVIAAYSVLLIAFVSSSGSKVVELSDRFLELRGESTWLIMFYAPWCGHCRKLEPTWHHIAQALYGTEIRVGRVDCTRFTLMATEFKIKGYPTIMYVKGKTQHYYTGDRTKDELVGFGLRMAAPPVPEIDVNTLKFQMRKNVLFFSYLGDREGQYWESFFALAKEYQYHHYFYSMQSSLAKEVLKVDSSPAVIVYKDGDVYNFPFFSGLSDINDGNMTIFNTSLLEWINHERFPVFMKFTHGNLPQLWKVSKYLTMVVVEESKVGELENESRRFRELVESVLKKKRNKYHASFQFGWTGTPDLANNIAMERLSLPTFIVVNTSSMEFFMPEDIGGLDETKMETFLDSVVSHEAPVLGGDSIPLQVFRMYFNYKTSLEDMWVGNPVLTAVLFGLPLGFLSLICYSIWCADLLDADEDEIRQEMSQEKKEQ